MAAREFQFDFAHSEPTPIRRHQRQLVVLKTEKNPVEDVASFVRRDCVRSLAQSVAQIFLPDGDNFRILEFWQRRKFFFGQPEDFEKALAAPDGSSVLSVNIYLNFTRRQFTDDVEEAAGRECGGPFFFYIRLATAANTDIEIGCREMDFVAVRLKQNVGKDGKSCARADHVLDLLQAFEQLFCRDTKFPYDGLRCKALGFIRQPQSLQCPASPPRRIRPGGQVRQSDGLVPWRVCSRGSWNRKVETQQ